jgi:DDE superfamily endonuclease
VSMPDAASVDKLKTICRARHHHLQDIYCTMDGLKIHFQSCNGLTKQSMYYNGWVHGHYISNLFVFSIEGRIIACCLNIPGSVHDSTIAQWSGIYDKLEEKYNETGGVCCVDSAFATNTNDYLFKSGQHVSEARDATHMIMMREATSLRQASEWGMRAIQGAFPRLKRKIKYEEKGERRRILQLVPLLYNYRLEAVGLNQIRNTYVQEWSKDNKYVK